MSENHFELLEMCDLACLRGALTTAEVTAKPADRREKFAVATECNSAELERAARG